MLAAPMDIDDDVGSAYLYFMKQKVKKAAGAFRKEKECEKKVAEERRRRHRCC
jgi:hypothetical protein